MTVVYEVKGTTPGPVRIFYTRPNGWGKTLNDVTLPWRVRFTAQQVEYGVPLDVNATFLYPYSMSDELTCRIIVNGRVIYKVGPTSSVAHCLSDVYMTTLS